MTAPNWLDEVFKDGDPEACMGRLVATPQFLAAVQLATVAYRHQADRYKAEPQLAGPSAAQTARATFLAALASSSA